MNCLLFGITLSLLWTKLVLAEFQFDAFTKFGDSEKAGSHSRNFGFFQKYWLTKSARNIKQHDSSLETPEVSIAETLDSWSFTVLPKDLELQKRKLDQELEMLNKHVERLKTTMQATDKEEQPIFKNDLRHQTRTTYDSSEMLHKTPQIDTIKEEIRQKAEKDIKEQSKRWAKEESPQIEHNSNRVKMTNSLKIEKKAKKIELEGNFELHKEKNNGLKKQYVHSDDNPKKNEFQAVQIKHGETEMLSKDIKEDSNGEDDHLFSSSGIQKLLYTFIIYPSLFLAVQVILVFFV